MWRCHLPRPICTPDLGLFLEEAEKVKQEMGSVLDILGRLQQANEESKSLHKSEALQSLRSKINVDILTVLKKTRTTRSQLEDMDRANAANRRLSAYKEALDGRTYKSEALQSLRSKINVDILTVLKKTRTTRSQLEDMDRANAANRRLSAYKEGTPI
ncbi:syntaxin-121-like [Prunus avium]|uniref:Syntaxin-121-like n=1 Tax=Prunus avium TaxID=42229 RepID=A0A6P5SWX5_PRUAV|nr:syntaxin-121-like [Prunus avium]